MRDRHWCVLTTIIEDINKRTQIWWLPSRQQRRSRTQCNVISTRTVTKSCETRKRKKQWTAVASAYIDNSRICVHRVRTQVLVFVSFESVVKRSAITRHTDRLIGAHLSDHEQSKQESLLSLWRPAWIGGQLSCMWTVKNEQRSVPGRSRECLWRCSVQVYQDGMSCTTRSSGSNRWSEAFALQPPVRIWTAFDSSNWTVRQSKMCTFLWRLKFEATFREVTRPSLLRTILGCHGSWYKYTKAELGQQPWRL